MGELREQSPRVLVVEDEPEMLRLVQAALEEAGMQVTGAPREGEALKRLREGHYGVVVTDLYVTRGQEELESIAALLREAGTTPVGVMSGWPVEEEVARAAGVAFVLRKPFALEELVRVVEEALAGGSKEQACQTDW
jgi:DNA-binding NtrC family response regulator